MEDIELLRKAWEKEHDSRDRRSPDVRNWEAYTVGATREHVERLVTEGWLVIALKGRYDGRTITKYKLSEKGSKLVWSTMMDRQFNKIPAATVLEAMDLVVGYDDIKQALARAVESHRRTNFLLEGPPACAKSVMLEGIRSAVPSAYIAFGSRTSASGLSEALFEHQPDVLLLDEADKMHMDVYAVLLGLMERGEILETKSQKTRGIKLETWVIAACNSSAKMPREFLSRFALHVHFPAYTRQEFIDVCNGFLTRAEGCPPELAIHIGELVFDYGIGDVRKARGVWQLMTDATMEEVHRVIQLMLKYSPENTDGRKKRPSLSRLPGI